MSAVGVGALALIGVIEAFAAVIALIVVWGLLFAAEMPIRQAYINGMIPSQQRATILSFDSLMSSAGGRLGPAGARQVRGRVGLRAVLPAQRRDLGARAAVDRALAAPEPPRGHAQRRPRPAAVRRAGDADHSSAPSRARVQLG